MNSYLNFQSDLQCEKDQLGFDKYIETLSAMIRDKDFKTPFCIGIFGKWGSGKTSFMHLLEKSLEEHKGKPRIIPVWFNPWRFQKEEHLIIPFLKTIESRIKKYINKKAGLTEKLKEVLNEAQEKICDAAAAIAYGMKPECKIGKFGFDFNLSLDVSKAVGREEDLKSRRIEEAKSLSDRLSSVYYQIVEELRNAVDENQFRIVVFIDDLDRCLPDKAVEILESIKLFLDIEGYLMVLGVDRDVVKKGISYRYRFFEFKEEKETEGLLISPEDYLDKMIQLPLDLPVLERGRRRRFIDELLGNAKDFTGHTEIIEAGVKDNPRTLKRFINLLSFTVRLAETIKENILDDKVDPKEDIEHKELLKNYFIPEMYIKWTIIVFSFPKVHNTIKGNKRMLIELQDAARREKQPESTEPKETEGKGIQLDERLSRVLAAGTPFPEDDWLIERFVLLTESTVVTKDKTGASPGYSQTYAIGDMVLIPKGSFLYGDEKIEKVIDNDYYIDVFPVTNRQYKEFLNDRKDYRVPYVNVEQAKDYDWDQEKRTYPQGMDDHPVVLVSYKDAEEYCEWRSKKEGEKYKLPTEEEWEMAARGTDGREYPWGDEFDKKKCNTGESGIGKTTPVNAYPEGKSPFGCFDMAGNVWEWTGSRYDKEGNMRVLRGGSWYDGRYGARCASRSGVGPGSMYLIIGFRCSRIKI